MDNAGHGTTRDGRTRDGRTRDTHNLANTIYSAPHAVNRAGSIPRDTGHPQSCRQQRGIPLILPMNKTGHPQSRDEMRRHRKVWILSVPNRQEEHTSELQSLMRISYAVFCLKKKKSNNL